MSDKEDRWSPMAENTHEDSLGFRASLGSAHRIADEVGSPRGMVGCVQEGQRQSVNAVVDRLVEGEVPCGCVEWKVDVGCVGPKADYVLFP